MNGFCILAEEGISKCYHTFGSNACRRCAWYSVESERRAEDVAKHGLKSKYSIWKFAETKENE